MRNDPRYDPYPIPIELLKESRKLIKRGATREQAAAWILSTLDLLVKGEPKIRKQIALFGLNIVQRQIVCEDRLKLLDPQCKESEGKAYDRLLSRIRNRRHEEKKRATLTEEDRIERRNRHNAYVRKRRRDPKVRETQRAWQRNHYAKRKAEDPEGHDNYLAEKRVKQAEARRDPEKAERMREHSQKYRLQRAERYRTDPEFREEEQARARAYYHLRKAQDHNYRSN